MMKKIIILVGVFIFTWGAAYLWGKFRYTFSGGSNKVQKLLSCEAGKIQKIEIIRKNSTGASDFVSFQRVGSSIEDVWKIQEPNFGDADEALLSRMISTACETLNPTVLTKKVDMENPELIVKFSDQNNITHTLSFSAELDGRDAIVRAEKGIFTLSIVMKKIFSAPANKYQNMRVMSASGDNIMDLCVLDDTKERYCLVREGSDWTVLKAGKKLGTGSEEANKYVNRLSTLLAIDLLATDKDFEACKKELPAKNVVRLEMSGVAGRKESVVFSTLLSSPKNPKQKILKACGSARNSLFAIHSDLLKFLNPSVSQLVLKNPAKQ